MGPGELKVSLPGLKSEGNREVTALLRPAVLCSRVKKSMFGIDLHGY